MLKRVIACFIIIGAIGCSNQLSDDKKTIGGHTLQVHYDAPGRTPNAGDWVIYEAYKFKGDQVVNSTRQSGKKGMFKLTETVFNKPTSPMYEAMVMLSEGDSASVIQFFKEGDPKPREYRDLDQIRYDLVIKNILSESEYKAYLDSIGNSLKQVQLALQEEHKTITKDVRQWIEDYKSGKLEDQLTELEGGTEMLVLDEGKGAYARIDQAIESHYSVFDMQGNPISNSFDKSNPAYFEIGDGTVIKGWNDSIAKLKKGGEAILFIPADQAYGASGYENIIPPNTELVMYIRLNNLN